MLSATIGNTFFCYSLTIGVFILFLGLGSASFDWIPRKRINFLNLAFIEIIMSINGLVGIYIITKSSLFYGSELFWIIALIPTIICGFFSGLELPFLIGLAPKKYLKVFGLDYIGMFLGAFLFPFFFLSYLGIFISSFVVAFLNFIVAIFLLYSSKGK